MARGDVRVTIIGRGRCARCAAELRRVRPRGEALCDPCRRAGPNPRRELPPDFYFQDPVAAALADYDFATVFRRVRGHTGWSQQTLGALTGLDQGRISSIERGASRLRDVALVAQVANALWIPPILLGFGDPGTTVGPAGVPGRKRVSWMERRDFFQHVTALAIGVTGATGLDLDRLTALLPHAEPTGTRHLGVADVEALEQATAAFRSQDFTHGSGLAHDTAIDHLRATLPLLNAQVSTELRPRLLIATADLATQAGWMSCDANHHDAARRLWMIALNIARSVDHPQGSDLTVCLLADMALQAVHLDRLQEALSLVHLGHTAAVSSYPVSASTTSLLGNIQARTHAGLADAAGCDRALGQATEHAAAIDPATSPPWTAYLSDIGVPGHRGSARYTLALHNRDPHTAGQAVLLLSDALDGFGPGYDALRAYYLPDLAGAHAIVGDTDTAVSIGHQAVDAVTSLRSPSAYDRLRVLNSALQPLHTSTGVAELRDRLSTTAA